MVDRRDFLKTAGLAAGGIAAAATPLEAMLREQRPPALSSQAPDVVVIGAGAFGGWSALYLQRMGATVTLVDQYGPGNSRASSGDETRGVRTGYGSNMLWSRWASEAIRRWIRFDDEFGREMKVRLFYQTGDLTCRRELDGFVEQSMATWQKLGIRHDLLTMDEARYRYPQIDFSEFTVVVHEHDAGVVRARRACEVVAEVFRNEGGTIITARAAPVPHVNGVMPHVMLEPGGALAAGQFVFACGPWLWKVFPDVLGNRMRTSLGYVYYFGTPPGDNRFMFPNMPSYNMPGGTGWPALGPDHRGFRVRTGGGPHSDPDTVERFIDPSNFTRPRAMLANFFPALRDMPLLETRACHYESSISRNFIVDRLPDHRNVWVSGCGNAEGFKQGPVVGEHTAHRVLGHPTNPELDANFRMPTATYGDNDALEPLID
ncbi:MAG TPA: FAD-dependent oxidoreductase [Longimicrobiales bacterium]|nr:FAD-dependent oxidoreductase [Longimicrobiales bacterium]